MGNSSWSNDSYTSLRSSYSTKSVDQIFTQNVTQTIAKTMDPKGLTVRESRDSVEHPHSEAVSIYLDVTGSMGQIPEYLIKNKLGTVMETLINHGMPDAHVLFGGIGDHFSDTAPLQVGQYEAGTKELDEWLTSIYLEGNGGGQRMESYSLAWLIAARHTSLDCFEKRGEKGFIFTIGDEWVHPVISGSDLKRIMGYPEAEDLKYEDILKEAQRTHHVFHLYLETGYQLLDKWRALMGENVIKVDDKDTIAEIIATTVSVVNGADINQVLKDFDSATAGKVSNALMKVSKDIAKSPNKGVMVL